jgi:hypothetical protein
MGAAHARAARASASAERLAVPDSPMSQFRKFAAAITIPITNADINAKSMASPAMICSPLKPPRRAPSLGHSCSVAERRLELVQI